MFLYSAVSSPLDRSKRFTLHPWQTCSFRHQWPSIKTTVYSQGLIYTPEWTEVSWRERKCPSFETAAKGIRTRASSIESPAFYRWATAPQRWSCTYGKENDTDVLIATLGSHSKVHFCKKKKKRHNLYLPENDIRGQMTTVTRYWPHLMEWPLVPLAPDLTWWSLALQVYPESYG